MRKLNGIETATVRLANELKDIKENEKVMDSETLAYLVGYSAAIKAFIEVEAENRGGTITANNDGFVITCGGTANEAAQ
jgi:hypothetical protein